MCSKGYSWQCVKQYVLVNVFVCKLDVMPAFEGVKFGDIQGVYVSKMSANRELPLSPDFCLAMAWSGTISSCSVFLNKYIIYEVYMLILQIRRQKNHTRWQKSRTCSCGQQRSKILWTHFLPVGPSTISRKKP